MVCTDRERKGPTYCEDTFVQDTNVNDPDF